MYIPTGIICTVRGEVFGDTLIDYDDDVKLPLKQKIQQRIKGYIQFIRNGDGVCEILRVVEFDFDHQKEE